MQPCYAITSSHLDLLWGRRSAQLHQNQPPSSVASARRYLIVGTLLRLSSVREEVASFLKHMKTKRKRAVCSSLVIVATVSVPLAEWQLLLTSYAAQTRPAVGALTLQYPEGRDRSCQNSHLSLLLQLLPPRGLLHTPC